MTCEGKREPKVWWRPSPRPGDSMINQGLSVLQDRIQDKRFIQFLALSGMVVRQEVCNSIQTFERLMVNKVNSFLKISAGMLSSVCEPSRSYFADSHSSLKF